MSEGIDHGEKTVTTEGKIIEPRRTRRGRAAIA